jgi:hypothetical protein
MIIGVLINAGLLRAKVVSKSDVLHFTVRFCFHVNPAHY